MTVIKINAITVPEGSGDELARRFASRAGAVDGQEGFEGFELLKPTDGRGVWLVVTRWRDEASFQAWVASPAFAHGHQGASDAGAPRRAGVLPQRAVVLRGEPHELSLRRGLRPRTPSPSGSWRSHGRPVHASRSLRTS